MLVGFSATIQQFESRRAASQPLTRLVPSNIVAVALLTTTRCIDSLYHHTFRSRTGDRKDHLSAWYPTAQSVRVRIL